MKKMFLMLAIMAIATGAFAAWDAGATETFVLIGTDTTGTLEGVDDATIYARFRVLGPEFAISINGGGLLDTWQVTDFMPGDYGTQTDEFVIENTGGQTLDISAHRAGITAASGVAVSQAAAAAYTADWVGTNNLVRLWAAIKGNTNAPADPTEIMTAANTLAAAVTYYGDGGYMEPVTGTYFDATGSSLTLYATKDIPGATGSSDKCDLYLAAQMPYAGWTTVGTQTVEVTVSARLTYAP